MRRAVIYDYFSFYYNVEFTRLFHDVKFERHNMKLIYGTKLDSHYMK